MSVIHKLESSRLNFVFGISQQVFDPHAMSGDLLNS
jgi:hypothetical protein